MPLAPEGYDLVRFLSAHVSDKNNPHRVSLSQVEGTDIFATKDW